MKRSKTMTRRAARQMLKNRCKKNPCCGDPFDYTGSEPNPAIITGVERIAAERQRQIEKEGWTPEHDDEHSNGEFAVAGACYAFPVGYPDEEAWKISETRTPFGWPWLPEWWKPSDDPIRNLEKAGALIAAEIDWLQRLRSTDS